MTIVHCSCGKSYNDKDLLKHLNSKHHQKHVEERYNKNPKIANKTYKKNKEKLSKMKK